MDKLLDFSKTLNKFNLKIDTNMVNKYASSSSKNTLSCAERGHQSNPKLLDDPKGEIGKDLETLRLQNYDRRNFNYDKLSMAGWWPDEILKFTEINRMSYIDFMQIFNNKSNMFDTPIRNAIYFMVQVPYCDDDDIKKFISHRTTDISDNYWNKVVDEDNCYMDGLESRLRSKNEYQHYYLLHALTKLLSYDNIRVDDLVLKEEYIKKIKIFIAIYNLKNIYSMLDDILRNILKGCIQEESIDLYLPLILYDTYFDLDRSVLTHARDTKDNDLLNRSYLYRDFILYGIYKTVQFSFVYSHHNDFVINNKLSQLKDNHMNPFQYEKYKLIFKEEDIERIEYIYLSLNNKIIGKQKKDRLIMENVDFAELLEQNENHMTKSRAMTPKYSMTRHNFNPNFPIFYISNNDSKSIVKRKNLLSGVTRHERSVSDSVSY
uniref:Uncharacterized protein n=1 Tax=Pithovirus LCPAC101 TaxID=2506586 RepID=A0A481Z3G7_9VIRU|nr:MAG: hypothetical protein LCPAC101_02890 [Pithovirus LCPAC101]